MKNIYQVRPFWVWVFIYSFSCFSTLSAQEQNLDCFFIEASTIGDEQKKALLSGSCQSCDCIKESFIQDDLTELERRYRSEMAEALRIRFAKQNIPSFINEMKEFDTVKSSCGLDRLQQLSCQLEGGLKDEIEGIFQTYFNRHESKGCFPERAINRVSKYRKANSRLVTLRAMLKSGADSYDSMNSLSDPLFAVYQENFERLKDVDPNYKSIKEAILNSSMKGLLSDKIDRKCEQFFKQMDAVFCQRPKDIPTDEKKLKDFLSFDPSGSFPQKASFRDLEIFTLKCQAGSCQSDPENKTALCNHKNDSETYSLDSLFEEDSTIFQNGSFQAKLDEQISSYEKYCPLLNCESFDEAYEVMDGLKNQCHERRPPWDLGDLVGHCKSDNAELVCQEAMLAELINNYDPKKDDPLPPPEQLLGGRSYEEVSVEEKREILKEYGYSDQSLNFLGDIGLKRAFGKEVELSGAPLSSEEREFRELGRDAARKQEATRQEKIAQAREKQEESDQNKNERSFSERFASKGSDSPQTQTTRKEATTTTQRPAVETTRSSALRPDSLSPAQNQISEQPTQRRRSASAERGPRETRADQDYRELESEIRNLRREAEEIKSQREREAYENEIAQLKDEVEQLKSDDSRENRGTQDSRRVQEDRTPRENLFPRPESDQAFRNSRNESQGELNEDSEFESASPTANAQENSGVNSEGQAGRAPAGVETPPGFENLANGESARYLERSSEELPLLSLENLEEVTPGEGFILGVREAEELKRIEMLPENFGEEVFYRPSFDEGLSLEAKASLLKSPFFQQYVHPDVKNELEESMRESASHHKLIKLLGEQTEKSGSWP